MFRKIALSCVWLAFTIYAFGFAPPKQPDTFSLIKDLSTGNWDGINPLIIALFNLMGVLPLLYACLIIPDGRGQKLPATPFSLLSLGVGAFALMPYLALRETNPIWYGEKDWAIKILDSRITTIGLTVAAGMLLGFGFIQGDWSDFIVQWQTSRFINVMSLDYCLLCLLFPTIISDDMAKRGWYNSFTFGVITLLPLVGPLIYLCIRPPLPSKE